MRDRRYRTRIISSSCLSEFLAKIWQGMILLLLYLVLSEMFVIFHKAGGSCLYLLKQYLHMGGELEGVVMAVQGWTGRQLQSG